MPVYNKSAYFSLPHIQKWTGRATARNWSRKNVNSGGGIRMGQQNELQALVSESRRIVFFGGAGVSTESGIPDFRSVDGLYSQQWKYPPETILSHTFQVWSSVAFRLPHISSAYWRRSIVRSSCSASVSARSREMRVSSLIRSSLLFSIFCTSFCRAAKSSAYPTSFDYEYRFLLQYAHKGILCPVKYFICETPSCKIP
mgnify:CR=1 FL=1